ncbi:MAG: flavin reductase [Rikenellaceae bacterium]
MDTTVLYNLTYGLYIVGAMDGDRAVGCTINTCFQVTSENPILAVSINKNNYTLDAIRRSGRFSLSILAEESDSSVIGAFGFVSSRDNDKYSSFGYDLALGTPLVRGIFVGRLILEVLQMVDNETHVVVLARLIDTVGGEGTPMTYGYYHKVVKGRAPKNAPTYVAESAEETLVVSSASSARRQYVCDICGFVHEAEGELAEDFVCPLCKQDRSHFKVK